MLGRSSGGRYLRPSHLIVLLFSLYFASVAEGQTPFVSLTSRGFDSTESGTPFFACYRSGPILNSQISIARNAYTFNAPVSNSPQPTLTSTFQNVGVPPTSDVYVSSLDLTFPASFGVFDCAAASGGQSTIVPSIFLRSDAKFVPTGGRYAKTVNAGDVNVTVDFTQVDPDDSTGVPRIWRQGGTIDPNVVLAGPFSPFAQLTTYTIDREVLPSDGGIYEIHFDNQRGIARAGLFNLIVRACPGGRYSTSSRCDLACESCYNGGICDDQTGGCVCPPGFMGEQCEIGCGGNRFGRNCEYRCDYVDDNDNTICAGLQVCVPDPYGCACAPGYKGLDCMEECEAGTFGASCTETCRCQSGQCDRFTGNCTGSSTQCMPGYTGNSCQECVTGRYGPDCTGNLIVNYEKSNAGQTAKVDCCLVDGTLISTADPVVTLYRRFGNETFATDTMNTLAYGSAVGFKYPFLVFNVREGEEFVCTVTDVNTFTSEITASNGFYVLPELPSPPVVSSATNDSVTLMWDAWNADTDVGDGPLLRYDVFYKDNSSSSMFKTVGPRSDGLAPSETVTGLEPDTDYVFGVKALRPLAGGAGQQLEVVGSTQCSPPTEGPTGINVTDGTVPGQVFVTWENPPETIDGANCRSGFTAIRIYYSRIDTSSPAIRKRAVDSYEENYVDVPLNMSSSGYNLTSLEPLSTYAISVVVLNKDSASPRTEVVFATTLEEVAVSVSPILVINANSTTIVVKLVLDQPLYQYGNVRGYELRYMQVEPEIGEETTVTVNTTQLQDSVYVITDVVDGNSYTVQVRVLNGAGYSDWSSPQRVRAVDPPKKVNIALITGIAFAAIFCLILAIVLLVCIVHACKRKREKDAIGRVRSTELVDNVLYESNLPTNQNGNRAVLVSARPLHKNGVDPEFAYISHERNSLLDQDLGDLDLTLQAETALTVQSAPPPSSSPASLLNVASLYATPTKKPSVSLDEPDGDVYENIGDIPIGMLVEHVEDKKSKGEDGFAHDFSLLPTNDGIPRTVASKPENKTKNRFKNMVTFDHSRVVLQALPNDPHSDYYNASYIEDHRGQKSFIASQAPNAASLNDFWRLIWQESVCSVVMVTNTTEGGKDRCTEYWPKEMGDTKTFGQVEVMLRTVEEYSDHVHRVMDVKQTDGNETRSVHQFHYRSWPDMGVPQYPTTLISFTESVKQVHTRITANTQGPTPMLVHCSAGVGRTGAFITLYCMLGQMRQEGKVNIFGFISKMRENRPKMVQTVDQYIFVHTGLVESYMSSNTQVPVAHFHAKLISLQERNTETNKFNMEQEFEILNQLTPPVGPGAFKAAVLPPNIDKNRYPNILPMEKNRPFLVTKGEAGSTDYINASFINTFMRKDAFLATQMPLPHTTGDIWRLAYDWRCPVIVMLNDLDTNDKSCAQYWPNQDYVQFGPLNVSVISAEMSRKDFIVRDFRIQGSSNEQPVTVKQFQLLGWGSKKSSPGSVQALLELMEAVGDCVRRKQATGPIILHCMNGIGRSGVFAAIYAAAEKMVADGVVDVFQAVKRLRALRPGMVESVEQYALCYEAIAEYMKAFDEYANLNMGIE